MTLNKINKNMIDPEFVKQVNDTAASLADTAKKTDNAANYFYTPSKVPAIDGTGDINVTTIKAVDIYALYDALMASYPNYISRTLLGNDQSGTIPVYKYVFEPYSFNKTVIVGANMHGHGAAGDPKDDAVALYYTIKKICEGWGDNPKLAELRHGVKIVVMPIQNPWGFNNDTRQNSRGVDLNRNFDYKWGQYPAGAAWQNTYKGTAPFSEKESQYVRDVLRSYPNATAYIDFHAHANINETFQYIYAGHSQSRMNRIADLLTKQLANKYGVSIDMQVSGYDSNPSSYPYAEFVLGIPSGNPEYVIFRSDGKGRTSEAMTQMVEWFGNWIYCCATNEIIKEEIEPEYFDNVLAISDVYSFDLSRKNIFSVETKDTIAKSIEFVNIPSISGRYINITVFLDYVNGASFKFPSSVIWQNGTAPTFSPKNKYILKFESFNNGLKWMASYSGTWKWSNNSETIIVNGNFANGITSWSGFAGTVSANNNTLTVTGNGTSSTVRAYQTMPVKLTSGKKFYTRCKILVTNSNCSASYLSIANSAAVASFSPGSEGNRTQTNPTINTEYTLSAVLTIPSGYDSIDAVFYVGHNYADAATTNGKIAQVKEVICVDLTEFFGVGKEPDSNWCNENIVPKIVY